MEQRYPDTEPETRERPEVDMTAGADMAGGQDTAACLDDGNRVDVELAVEESTTAGDDKANWACRMAASREDSLHGWVGGHTHAGADQMEASQPGDG